MNGKFASKSKKIDDVGFGIIKAIGELRDEKEGRMSDIETVCG